MKTSLDFVRIAQLPLDERREIALKAMNAKEIEPKTALELIRGEVPSIAAQTATGTNAYGATQAPTTKGKPLAKNAALYGVAMARDLGEGPANKAKAEVARREIDDHLTAIGNARGDAQRLAVRRLQDYLGKVGPDVVDAISVGGLVRDNGIGYVNARLRELGVNTSFEPIMDAASRRAAKLARPGEITGDQGQIRLGFHPYDEGTKRVLRSMGNNDQGRWSVTFEGQENFDFRANSDRSVSMRRRELTRSMEAPELADALSGFVKMLGEQALPQGYTFDVDLEKVPADRRAEAKAALAALSDYGAEVRYLDNDLHRMMDRFRRIGEIDRQLEPLISKGREKWTPDEAKTFCTLSTEWHSLQGKQYES